MKTHLYFLSTECMSWQPPNGLKTCPASIYSLCTVCKDTCVPRMPCNPPGVQNFPQLLAHYYCCVSEETVSEDTRCSNKKSSPDPTAGHCKVNIIQKHTTTGWVTITYISTNFFNHIQGV